MRFSRILSAGALCAAVLPAVLSATTIEAGAASASQSNGCITIAAAPTPQGWQAIAARNCNQNFFGYIKIDAPDHQLRQTIVESNANQTLMTTGALRGRICASAWQFQSKGKYTNRGTACETV